MNRKERERLKAVEAVQEKRLKQREAAKQLGAIGSPGKGWCVRIGKMA